MQFYPISVATTTFFFALARIYVRSRSYSFLLIIYYFTNPYSFFNSFSWNEVFFLLSFIQIDIESFHFRFIVLSRFNFAGFFPLLTNFHYLLLCLNTIVCFVVCGARTNLKCTNITLLVNIGNLITNNCVAFLAKNYEF
jgi:hypothetical protein